MTLFPPTGTPEPLDPALVRGVIRDAAPTPSPRLLFMERLARKDGAEWLLEILDAELHTVRGGPNWQERKRLAPDDLPAPERFLAIKERAKGLLANATDGTAIERAAAMYFGAIACFEGHAERGHAPPSSSLSPHDLEEVYVAMRDALGADWERVLDRALERLGDAP